jgi:hypothetical protein
MNEQQRTLWGFAVFSFAITTIVYQFVDQYLLSSGASYLPAFVITFLACGAIYSLLFDSLVRVYDRFLFRLLSPIQAVKGSWFHIGTIDSLKEIRYGKVRVTNELGEISISGDSYDENGIYKSSFHSLVTYVDHTQLLVLYKSEGSVRAQNPIRNGIMELTFVETTSDRIKKPLIVKGVWRDVIPSNNNGTIMFYFNEKEWEIEKTKQIQRMKQERLRNVASPQ